MDTRCVVGLRGRRLVAVELSAAAIRQGHRVSLSIAGVFTLLTLLVTLGVGDGLSILLCGYVVAMAGVVLGLFVRDPDD